jgi:hypothetical protein
MFTLVELLCILLLFLTLRTLKTNSGVFSTHTYKLHLQVDLNSKLLILAIKLTVLLGAELLIPFVFIFVPVVIAIVSIICGYIPTELEIQIGTLELIFYGMANCLLTIIFIQPFRTHFNKTFILFWLMPLLIGIKKRLSNT